MRKIMVIWMTLTILFGCSKGDEGALEPTNNSSYELSKLTTNIPIDQNPSNKAKLIVSRYEYIAGVRAVNANKELVIGIDVNQFDRFRLKEIKKELKQKIKEDFSEMTITLSTDKKISLELKRLEEEIQTKQISEEALKKKLKEIKNLSEEET